MVDVSVIIPTYNRSTLLQRSIESAKMQTIDNIEVIVVDDCSTDNTSEIVKKYSEEEVKYIKHDKNKGVSAARNTGIKTASGMYLAFLDSDDVWHPQKIEKQLQVIQNSYNHKAVYCACTQKSNSILKQMFSYLLPELEGKSGGEELICDILSQKLPVHPGSTLLLESKIIDRIGYFDEDLRRQEDLEFIARLLSETNIKYINEPLVTLYDTGRPDTDILISAREKYVQKSINHLCSMEEYDTFINSNKRQIANGYLRDGNFNDGIRFLKRSKFNTKRDYAATVFNVLKGIKNITN